MYLPRASGIVFAALTLMLHIWGGFLLGYDILQAQFLFRGVLAAFIGGILGYGLGRMIMIDYLRVLESQLMLAYEDRGNNHAAYRQDDMPELDLGSIGIQEE